MTATTDDLDDLGLVWVDDSVPGLRRRRCGRSFTYLSARGKTGAATRRRSPASSNWRSRPRGRTSGSARTTPATSRRRDATPAVASSTATTPSTATPRHGEVRTAVRVRRDVARDPQARRQRSGAAGPRTRQGRRDRRAPPRSDAGAGRQRGVREGEPVVRAHDPARPARALRPEGRAVRVPGQERHRLHRAGRRRRACAGS